MKGQAHLSYTVIICSEVYHATSSRILDSFCFNLLYLPYSVDQKINDPWQVTRTWALPVPHVHPCNNCEGLGFFADPLHSPTTARWFSDKSNLTQTFARDRICTPANNHSVRFGKGRT